MALAVAKVRDDVFHHTIEVSGEVPATEPAARFDFAPASARACAEVDGRWCSLAVPTIREIFVIKLSWICHIDLLLSSSRDAIPDYRRVDFECIDRPELCLSA